ncbi:hypothetical protein VTK56DRAFT_5709 [Thermocarpiscus australiensis]
MALTLFAIARHGGQEPRILYCTDNYPRYVQYRSCLSSHPGSFHVPVSRILTPPYFPMLLAILGTALSITLSCRCICVQHLLRCSQVPPFLYTKFCGATKRRERCFAPFLWFPQPPAGQLSGPRVLPQFMPSAQTPNLIRWFLSAFLFSPSLYLEFSASKITALYRSPRGGLLVIAQLKR